MNIVSIIITLLILVSITMLIVSELENTPITCNKYIEVKYRMVGSGGLFGGVSKVETQSDDFDGYMKVCSEGKTVYGKKWEKETGK